jgi:hypothetical protein
MYFINIAYITYCQRAHHYTDRVKLKSMEILYEKCNLSELPSHFVLYFSFHIDRS